MKVLIAPDFIGLSGGSVYNRRAFPDHRLCSYEAWKDLSLADKEKSNLIVDSFYYKKDWEGQTCQYVALSHYLESENPLLSQQEKKRALLSEFKFYDNAESIICTGQKVFKSLKERHPKKHISCVWPAAEGVKEAKLLDVKCHSLRFLSVGRLEPEKGVARTAEWLKALDVKLEWHHIGALKDQTEHLKVQDIVSTSKVRWRQSQELLHNELCSLYSDYDVFIQGSLFESFGMACFEAACSGLFIVSSDVGDVVHFTEKKQFYSLESKEDFEKSYEAWSKVPGVKKNKRSWSDVRDEIQKHAL